MLFFFVFPGGPILITHLMTKLNKQIGGLRITFFRHIDYFLDLHLSFSTFPERKEKLKIAPKRQTIPRKIHATRLKIRKMTEHDKTQKALKARIAELEAQVQTATERALRAERERDERPPTFDEETLIIRPVFTHRLSI